MGRDGNCDHFPSLPDVAMLSDRGQYTSESEPDRSVGVWSESMLSRYIYSPGGAN